MSSILTGFIEPHFFAGFSGGPKAILPSLAGAESVFTNHGLAMIGHPRPPGASQTGNPIWEEMREVALRTEPTFLLNVALNTRRADHRRLCRRHAAAHAAGCEFVEENAMVPVDAPYDIVVTTNSGYPLDQNLYQSVKGMSAAARWCARAARSSWPRPARMACPATGGMPSCWPRRVAPGACWT